MTVVGKLLVFSIFIVALCMATWATTLYGERPVWHLEPPADADVDKGHTPRYFKQMKTEIESLNRSAAVASEAWGTHLKALENREKLRVNRQAAYRERLVWAHKGNPNDLIDPADPKSGRGFYTPVIDSKTGLYDLTLTKGKPRGQPAQATDGSDLPSVDGLLDSIATDAEAIKNLNADILAQRQKFTELSNAVKATEDQAIKMGIIRSSVQAELFFLQNFEVNVSETRETVFRRDRQLRTRLKSLGVFEP